MNKFKINLDTLQHTVLLDCIIYKSKVAVGYDPADFYTNNKKEPKDWIKGLIADARKCDRIRYRDRDFLVLTFEGKILYVFYQHKVYSFDQFYTDCPIFAEILRAYR